LKINPIRTASRSGEIVTDRSRFDRLRGYASHVTLEKGPERMSRHRTKALYYAFKNG
jgi:hypothetical protein